ncbi:MAG: hypothetical protein ACR650_04925 [Methylocystis sp.]
MAKKKSRSSNGAPKLRLTPLIAGVAIAGAAGGYFAGKKDIERNVAGLIDFGKSATQAARPAPEPKSAEAPRPVKAGDKAELARLLKAMGAKTPEPKTAEPNAAAENVPTPPVKPELAATLQAPKPPEEPRPDVAKPDSANFPHPPAPIAFTFLDKSADAGARVTLSLNFENLAGKPIRAFEGVMKLTDLRDRNIYSSKIAVSALISEGGALRWDEQVDSRKLDEKSRRLMSEDKENLKAVFVVKKIFFVDGSVRKFDARG